MRLRAFVAGAKRGIVPPGLDEAECTVWASSDDASIVIVLPVVFPEAHRTHLETTTLTQRQMMATRAGEPLPRDRTLHHGVVVELPAVAVEPTPTAG